MHVCADVWELHPISCCSGYMGLCDGDNIDGDGGLVTDIVSHYPRDNGAVVGTEEIFTLWQVIKSTGMEV